MDVRQAVEILRANLGDGSDDPISLAWAVLDRAMSHAGDLPIQWSRYTSGGAALFVGLPQRRWATETSVGRAPGSEGLDTAGRQVWSRATLERFKAGEWVPDDTPPPLDGPGGTIQAWRKWARRQGVAVRSSAGPAEIHALAVRMGVLSA